MQISLGCLCQSRSMLRVQVCLDVQMRWCWCPSFRVKDIHDIIRVDKLNPVKSEWADYAVQTLGRNLSWKEVHTFLVWEHLSTVVSAC